jgi:hypothetical protein
MQSLGLDVKVHKRAGAEEQQAELEGLERFATAAGF